jgi:DNA-binding NarL/FixJ family response regulator
MGRTRLVLADDHQMLLDGLIVGLGGAFEVVGTAQNGRELIEVARTTKPDVVVSDISMPELNGLDAARILKKEQSSIRFVFMTMHTDLHLVEEAFRAGATGYVLKIYGTDALITAINSVARGNTYISPLLAGDVISTLITAGPQPTLRNDVLTIRQREVLQLLAEGQTMKAVAARLGISNRTAESHKYEIMRQLGLRTSADLVRYAVRTKLVHE